MRAIGVYEVVIEDGRLTSAKRGELEKLIAQGQARQIAKLRAYQIVELMPDSE